MAAPAAPSRTGGGPKRTAVAIALAVAVVAAAAGGVLAWRTASSPGPSRPGPTEIDLLPSEGTRSGCIVGTPGVARPTAALHYGTMQANTYSVPAGTSGHVGMCYNATSGAMFAYANWSLVGAGGGWFSYPQVAYGVDLYAGEATVYTNQSPAWTLPQTVASTVDEDLWVTASYGLNAPRASDVSGYDLSFDDFFSQGLPPTLEVPPFVEVEIFLAHNISYPFDWLHWSALTLVNGTLSDEPWDVGYWCHGADNSTNGNVSFDFSFDGQATHGLAAGTLGVNLSAVLAEVETLLPGASCWTGPTGGFSDFYLGEEDLGSEDGAVGGASYNYNWTVTQYCLHTLVDPTAATAVLCSTGAAADRVASSAPTGEPPVTYPGVPLVARTRTPQSRSPRLGEPPTPRARLRRSRRRRRRAAGRATPPSRRLRSAAAAGNPTRAPTADGRAGE